MKTSQRLRERPDPRSFAARKGHLPQLSISDDNHHVTEAIGYMYGDEDSPSSPQSPARHSIRSDRSLDGDLDRKTSKKSLARRLIPDYKSHNGDRVTSPLDTPIRSPMFQQNGWHQKGNGSPVSPLSARENSPSDVATTQFPINDIDYESSPAAVAQELSNLQALRRLSMDVGAAGDPDLPPLNVAAMPSAPSSATSEDDSARLFWVPARLHPELAPKEFKTFLESKAEQIKRRSGELSAFASPTSSRSNSLSAESPSGGLKRKKSMLSRQIDSSVGYQDGADRLELKRSQEQNGQTADPNLQELESLVSGALPRLSLENKSDEDGDMILPSMQGSSLKRSTRTKYQRPESRKGPVDRTTFAERAKRRAVAGSGTGEISPTTPTIHLVPSEGSLSGFSTDVSNLASTLMDPSSDLYRTTTNFSRPGNRSPSPPPKDVYSPVQSKSRNEDLQARHNDKFQPPKRAPTAPATGSVPDRPIPQIIESPPQDDHPVRTSSMAPPPSSVYSIKPDPASSTESASTKERPKTAPVQRPGMPAKQSSSALPNTRPSSRGSNMPPQTPPIQTLEQPSPLPGHDTNTSNLSFIPTLTVDKRQDHKKKEEKKSGWSWLRGREESEKEKDKAKTKPSKATQSYDSTRLDLLQTSIDGGPRGRESLVLDRESLKLEEERRKESQRKSSGGERKEKESLFSSIFGGKKNKAEKDAQRKAHEQLSPEPRYRELKPDIDYNWTRFSILEERAIYRMAHFKLANPRRALYSQVLLSNFMYSYLAKVQQMHPQMNLPTSAKQQRKQKEQQQQHQQEQRQQEEQQSQPDPQQENQGVQQQQQQPDEFTQYQRYHQQQGQQPVTSSSSHAHQAHSDNYDGDSTVFDFNYSRDTSRSNSGHSRREGGSSNSAFSSNGQYSTGVRGATLGNGNSRKDSSHYQQAQRQQHRPTPRHNYDDDDDDDDDDMW